MAFNAGWRSGMSVLVPALFICFCCAAADRDPSQGSAGPLRQLAQFITQDNDRKCRLAGKRPPYKRHKYNLCLKREQELKRIEF